MLLEKGRYKFLIQRAMKTTKPDFHQYPIAISEYPSNWKIRIVNTIIHYLEITKNLRFTGQLIISYKKPQKAVTTNTISKWRKVTLGKAGIDIEKYSSHSTRSASTSKAKITGLLLSEINKATGWKEISTFKTFEDLVIQWHVIVNQT